MHWDMNKMATIVQTKFWNGVSLVKTVGIMIQVVLRCVPKVSVDDKSALIRIIALTPKKRQTITWTIEEDLLWRHTACDAMS